MVSSTVSSSKLVNDSSYEVADIELADFGRKELAIAEKEMPGLMALREKYIKEKPLQGARIAGSLHMTIQTGVLIETLVALGAQVRWASCNIFSTQDHAASAIAKNGIPVFAKKGETLTEYWSYTHRILEWGALEGPNMILDDGGDATGLVILGDKASQDSSVLDNPSNEEEIALFASIRKKLSVDASFYSRIKGMIAEIDPICALQAAMEGYRVVRLDDVVEQIDIFVTATGNYQVICHEHLIRMKDEAIVSNIGHFDNEIDVASLKSYKWENIKPQVDHITLPSGNKIILLAEGRLVNLGCATGHPSFVMSNSFTNQVLAQIELFTKGNEYSENVYVLPKHLDEMVARLHLEKIGAQLTQLTSEQADYINVPVQGPYKPEQYRY